MQKTVGGSLFHGSGSTSVECTSPGTERVPISTDFQKESKIISVWTIFYVILYLCALSVMVWQKSARKKCLIIIIIIMQGQIRETKTHSEYISIILS